MRPYCRSFLKNRGFPQDQFEDGPATGPIWTAGDSGDDRRRLSRWHRQIMDPYAAGQWEAAAEAYQRWLPLIDYENRQCGLLAIARRLDPMVRRWGR